MPWVSASNEILTGDCVRKMMIPQQMQTITKNMFCKHIIWNVKSMKEIVKGKRWGQLVNGKLNNAWQVFKEREEERGILIIISSEILKIIQSSV